MNYYITADVVGRANHGGGQVTGNERDALASIGECQTLGRAELQSRVKDDPWDWDNAALNQKLTHASLAHFYAGTFSRTIAYLKDYMGTKVTYTAAAHDVQESKAEYERLGIPFQYPHLTDPVLWAKYVQGYLDADVLICPSIHSAKVMRGFGAKQRIQIIPHGITLPPVEVIKPLPRLFTVGYLGAVGPDKGIRYLLEAWKRLNYNDALLCLAGEYSNSPFMHAMVKEFGGGGIHLKGWVDKLEDFFGGISVYIQPSVTEGFGIEVLESLAHGRVTFCSRGAGACDVLPEMCLFEPKSVDALVEAIETARALVSQFSVKPEVMRGLAELYSWDNIRPLYSDLWRSL